jgi:hypothetical protein
MMVAPLSADAAFSIFLLFTLSHYKLIFLDRIYRMIRIFFAFPASGPTYSPEA